MHGFRGAILDVDLSSACASVFEPPEAWYRHFLGGRGLGVRILASSVPRGLDPLDPAMPLLFLVGPLTGTNFPTAGRFVVVSRSPLTGTVFDAHSGGFFGAALEACGVDGIRVTGASPGPVYLYVEDGRVEFRDAGSLWGLETQDARDRILEETPKGTRVALIGPAGERRVRLACIMNDAHRAAGRGGLGAVMGAKNLKALAVRGSGRPSPASPDRLATARESALRVIKKNPVTGNALPALGTAVLVNIINDSGMFPTGNFRSAVFNDACGISGEKMNERIVVKKSSCFACPIACGRTTRTSRESGEGPEYETLWAFGAQCGVNDLEAVAHANYRCNRLGLDTISVGSTIGCAMELAEEGLIRGIPDFGDGKAVVDLVEKIGLGQGVGEELGEGAMRLASEAGRPDLAMHVKGLELPAYDPRGVQGQALSFATSNRGGCHLRAYMISTEILGQPCLMDRFATAGKAEVCVYLQHISAAVDSLILCRFTQFALSADAYAEGLSAVTGQDWSAEDLLKAGERIWNLERLFNVREGMKRESDTLPPRLLREELDEGASRGRVPRLDAMLDEYYSLRGWDRQGVPTPETLASLDLEKLEWAAKGP